MDQGKGSISVQNNGFAFSKLAVSTWGFALEFRNFPGLGVDHMPGNERSHDCIDTIYTGIAQRKRICLVPRNVWATRHHMPKNLA